MPIVALISATAVPMRSGGSLSRRMLMPTAMSAAPKPCSALPTIIVRKETSSAQITEPRIIAPSATSSIRRLPYMSAIRAMIGVPTAAVSRVAVTSQEESEAEMSSSSGNSGRSGITRVNCSAETMPHRDSTRMVAQAGAVRCIRLLGSTGGRTSTSHVSVAGRHDRPGRSLSASRRCGSELVAQAERSAATLFTRRRSGVSR